MKRLLLTCLLLAGCGGTKDSPPEATPAPTTKPEVSASPTPTPVSKSESLVGNWLIVDTSSANVLSFNSDGTGTSGPQKLEWSVDSENQIHFTANKVEVDSCDWDILTSGGLTTPLIETLDLGCLKSGALKYTRAP